MKTIVKLATLSAALLGAQASFGTQASAQVQGVNLTGPWRCVANCQGAPSTRAFITQNGWEMNIVDETGRPSRAWVNYPGRIWLLQADQGAIYSPDGIALQFDRGGIWRRARHRY